MNSANLDSNLSTRLAHTTLQSQETPDNFYSFNVTSLQQFHKESVYYKIEGL